MRDYTIQMQPLESGVGFTATIVELQQTVTGLTQSDAWSAAQRIIFEEQGRLLEVAKGRRRKGPQQQSRTVA